MGAASRTVGSEPCSRPLINAVLPQPAKPTSMHGTRLSINMDSQKLTEHVSGVGTVIVVICCFLESKSMVLK